MNSAADIWERVLSLMQQTMTETTITTWFSDAEPIALDENRFILYVPTDFKREIVASRYIGDIKKALYDLFSAELEVVVLSEEEKEKYGKREPVSRFLPGTEEYVTVFAGEAEIGLPGETYRLRTGDSLRFPADQPHRYRNPGAEEAQLSMLIWYRG